jgi:hypothetical protein
MTGRGDDGDSFIIEGSAELVFPVPYELYPGTRVHEGYWTRPPKVINTPYFYMTEGVGDRVQVGCKNHSIAFWLKRGKEVLLEYGLPETLYDEFYQAMIEMKQFKKQMKSPTFKKQEKPDDSSVV